MLSGNVFVAPGAALRNDRRLRFILLLIILIAAAVGNMGCAGRRSEPVLEEYTPADPHEEGEAVSASASEVPLSTASASASEVPLSTASAASPARTVTVHVCGAVKKEGVYTLPAGSRVRDAVEAAGGFSEDADTAYLNLALEAEDAWQIRVPTTEEADALRRGDDPASVYGEGSAAASGAASAAGGAGSGAGYNGKPGLGISAGSGSGNGNGTDAGLAPDGAPKVDLNSASKEDLMRIPGIGESKARLILEYREQNGRFEHIEDLMKIPGIKDASFQKMKEYVTV